MICHCTLHAQQLPEGSDANSDPSDKSLPGTGLAETGQARCVP